MEPTATQLSCPNCGESIPPDKINIQQTLALCPACGTVFNFGDDLSPKLAKVKRRKAKQPEQITVTEDDTRLEMRFSSLRTRADKIGMGILLFFMLGLTVLLVGAAASDGKALAGLVIGSIFGGVSLFPLLMLFSYTKISLDDDQISAVTKPVSTGNVHLDRYDVADVIYEEAKALLETTTTSPTYNVYAVRHDGSKRLIHGSIQEDYAAFITQELRQRLHNEDAEMAFDNLRDASADEDDVLGDAAYSWQEEDDVQSSMSKRT